MATEHDVIRAATERFDVLANPVESLLKIQDVEVLRRFWIFRLQFRRIGSSAEQDTWVYRFFGAYDNVVGPPNTAPTHGTEVPFFHGGNECFSGLQGVTEEQQALADSVHTWFVSWIKNPAAGPGWEKVSESGALVKLGVPGDELSRIPAKREEFNGVCRSVYNPAFPKYPVVQSVAEIVAGL